MTSPAQPPVQAVPGFTLDGSDDFYLNPPVTFFTLPGDSSGRIDAIYLPIVYPSGAGDVNDQYGIQYLAPGGAIQGQAWSPVFTYTTTITQAVALFLTWTRTGTGTDQLASAPFSPTAAPDYDGFFTGLFSLPDTVLQPLTQVQVIRALDGPGGPIVSVNGATVTYTPNAGAVSVTDTYSPVPLLVPAG